MTLEQAQALRVGDMVKYRTSTTETLEIVTGRIGDERDTECVVELRTIAVLLDEENKFDIGDEGWINGHNVGSFEKIA